MAAGEAEMTELIRLTGERDGYRRVSEEAMKLMTDEQIAELRRRLDELDRTAPILARL